MTEKPEFCAGCPINHVTQGYVAPVVVDSHELIVGEAAGSDEIEIGQPFVGGAGRWLNSLLKASGQPRSSFNIINVLGCRPPANVFPTASDWDATSRETGKAGVEYCKRHHLQPFLDSKDWRRVIALGNVPLEALTPRTGITTWRGSPLPLRGKMDRPRVIPTLHPAFLMRGSNMFPIVQSDLRKTCNLPPEKYNLYASPAEVEAFDYKRFVFDFEWDVFGDITIAGVCGRPYEVLVFPWAEPYVRIMKRKFEEAEDLYGHNIINADTTYFDKWGWTINARIWDTMLMQHLVQPDFRHGLAFVSSVFTNRVHWKGDGEDDQDAEDGEMVPKAQWKTWNSPHAIPLALGGYGGCKSEDEAFRLYNARDNASNYDIIEPLHYLLDRYNLGDLYWNVSRPVAYLCRDMGSQGLKVDQSRLAVMATKIDADIVRLEAQLPDGLRPYTEEVPCRVEAPPDTFKPAKRICKGTKKANTSHDPIEVWFTVPETVQACPVCQTIVKAPKLSPIKTMAGTKTISAQPWNSSDKVIAYASAQGLRLSYNSKTKQLSADKNARKAWGKHETAFVTIDQLKRLSTLRNGFAKEGLQTMDRMYYNILVHGTGEGRLSSRGARRGIDMNVQNIPYAARGIFVPDTPDDAFLSADIGQGENILTTWLAEDWERWERITTPGYDEHSDLANKIFGCDCSATGPNAALRQIGKKVNHMRNYGGSANKIHEILIAEGFSIYTKKDCDEFISVWKSLNSRTSQWQDETIALAMRQGFLRNAFGRIRWFQTADFANKALAFLPASTLADCVLRMMIGLHLGRFSQEISNLQLVNAGDLPEGWKMRLQVHDDITLHGPFVRIQQAADVLSHVMTQPWPQLRNLAFKVGIKYSQSSWGDLKAFGPVEALAA